MIYSSNLLLTAHKLNNPVCRLLSSILQHTQELATAFYHIVVKWNHRCLALCGFFSMSMDNFTVINWNHVVNRTTQDTPQRTRTLANKTT